MQIVPCLVFVVTISRFLSTITSTSSHVSRTRNHRNWRRVNEPSSSWDGGGGGDKRIRVKRQDNNKCPSISPFKPEIDTAVIFPTLDFEGTVWKYNKTAYWNPAYETRYQALRNLPPEGLLPLKVIVVPFSHNDPGWLQTFEEYFTYRTQNILDNLVKKMNEFPAMKFLWSEISFLAKWWSEANPGQRQAFQKLVKDGRVEIVTGGWVMTDEATMSLYSMINELVEGHQWVKAHLNVTPTRSWSIDPFGHGSTLPYLLQAASIQGMVIQRIHHGWKRWFADKQRGDFRWVPRWDNAQQHGILCHNAPFDSYNLKYCCGPFPEISNDYDFYHKASIPSEYVGKMAEQMLEQYGRTASFFPHNVILIPMGDDFRFQTSFEWDHQYKNHQQLFDYINDRPDQFNKAEIQFGTVSDYFRAVEERGYQWKPTLSGDFFVYGEVFESPNFWSGYYGTRPYWKRFYRETESKIRDAEILFTFGNALLLQKNENRQVLNKEYGKLVVARRWLALFAHHDGNTGTSNEKVMLDYGHKLSEARKFAEGVQSAVLTLLLGGSPKLRPGIQLDKFGDLPHQEPLHFSNPSDSVKRLVFWNGLAHKRVHLAKVTVSSARVEILGADGNPVVSQLNPVLERDMKTISSKTFEVAFLAELPPLSVAIYQVRIITEVTTESRSALPSTIYCNPDCTQASAFQMHPLQKGGFQLNNSQMELLFDSDTGFLQKVTRPGMEPVNVALSFGKYSNEQGRSGAYLLKPDVSQELPIPFKLANGKIFLVRGPIFSEIIMSNAPITLRTRVMNSGGPDVQSAVWMQNQVDLGSHNGELFMRLDTTVESATMTRVDNDTVPQPTWWTDQSGFTFEKRVKVPKIPYEGNNYPVNTMIYVQDQQWRLSLMVDRSQGCGSMEMGRLECIVERRVPHDDTCGLLEGVTDNRVTISNYVLFLEEKGGEPKNEHQSNLPSLQGHHLSLELSYPAAMFVFDDLPYEPVLGNGKSGIISLLNQELPCDVHLVNLRTLTDASQDYDLNLPSDKALMILQRLGHSCAAVEGERWNDCSAGANLFWPDTKFNGLTIRGIAQTDLTGVSNSSRKLEDLSGKTDLNLVTSEPFEITSLILNF